VSHKSLENRWMIENKINFAYQRFGWSTSLWKIAERLKTRSILLQRNDGLLSTSLWQFILPFRRKAQSFGWCPLMSVKLIVEGSSILWAILLRRNDGLLSTFDDSLFFCFARKLNRLVDVSKRDCRKFKCSTSNWNKTFSLRRNTSPWSVSRVFEKCLNVWKHRSSSPRRNDGLLPKVQVFRKSLKNRWMIENKINFASK
jgi:hypothetical protein